MSESDSNSKHRLFVALDLPEEHASALCALRDNTISARWTSPQQYHLTLQFIGYVDANRRAGIADALRTIREARFSLKISGFGAFPSLRRPRVLVALVEGNGGLAQLQQSVVRTLSGAGIEPEDRPFKAHLTLARLKNAHPRQVQSYLHEHDGFHLDPFTVATFHLYESTLRPSGAVYERLETYTLD